MPAQKREQIQTTIDRLKLNDHPAFVDERAEWLRQYCIGNTNFSGLKEVAPFIAYELERQNLVGKIKKMMKFELNEEDILVSEKVTSLSET